MEYGHNNLLIFQIEINQQSAFERKYFQYDLTTANPIKIIEKFRKFTKMSSLFWFSSQRSSNCGPENLHA